jgi:hypothetical protein
MKKIYITIMLVFTAIIGVNAQATMNNLASKLKETAKINSAVVTRNVAPTQANQPAAVLWTDDFSAPGNWVLTHDAGTTTDWLIGTTIPAGSFPIPAINSASAANGFALFDSDFYCDTANGQVGNLTTAMPIDLTGHDSIRLSFSQYYKRFYDSTYVFISNDNATWTRYEVNAPLTNNQFSANNSGINPDIVSIDISSVAGNQDSVYIRFQFYSPDNLNALSGCAYSWMIDDVSLSDFPAVDASLDLAFTGEYCMLPVIQTEPFTLRGKLINKGLAPLTGAKILFDVYDPLGGIVYQDSTAAAGTINVGDTSGFLTSLGSYLPLDTGLYIVDQFASATGDGDNTNDNVAAFAYVSDSMYARDYLDFDINSYGGRLGFQGAPVSFGSVYTVYHTSEFTSSTFYLAQPTLGDHISVSVFDMVGGIPTNEIGSTGVYTITAADTGGTAFITLPFTPSVNVVPGDYVVAINQLDTNRLSMGYTEFLSTPSAEFINLDGGGWITFDSINLVATPILRVNNPSGTLVSTKNNIQISAFNVFPNPSTGVVYFSGVNGQIEKNVAIAVFNNLGEVVKTFTFESAAHGRIDLSSLPAGVYSLNIRTNSIEENKTIVLQ